MLRPRLQDFQLSRGPQALGITPGDLPKCARAVNAAQQRLLYDKAQGEEGWYGTWAEMSFAVDPSRPYITLPRGVARIEALDVGNRTLPLRNQFYEFMDFGNGYMRQHWHRRMEGGVYARNNTPTWFDLTGGAQPVSAMAVNPLDAGKRILISGLDENQRPIVTLNSNNPIQGEYVTLSLIGSATVNSFSQITGIQKDVTIGHVTVSQTVSNSLLVELEPSETSAWYRRYYLSRLPVHCVGRVRALVKLDFIPVSVDSDYLLIPNVEAVIEEAQSVRLGETDDSGGQQQAALHHQKAIQLLIGQVNHYIGKDSPGVNFKPFGSASLNHVRINMT